MQKPTEKPLKVCQLCFVFVSCVHRRVMEGSGEGSGGCVTDVKRLSVHATVS